MRILWIGHFIPYPPKGGSLQRSYNLIRELSKHHDVWFVGLNQKALISDSKGLIEATNHLNKFLQGVETYEMNSSNSAVSNYSLAIYSLLSKWPFFNNWLKHKKLKHKINEIIVDNNIELVHFDTIGLVQYINIPNGSIKVLNHHNIESAMMLRRSEKETNLLRKMYCYIEGKKIQRVEEKYCPQFSLNLTCSKLDTDRLRDISPKAVAKEVPNGVDLDYFTPDHSTEEDKVLIFAGGLSWYPNLSAMTFFLNKVWPALKLKEENIKLYVIGRNPPKWMISMGEKDPNLIVTGFVPDVRVYLNLSQVYICPISDGGGTKLKVLDALAMEKPLVAHPIACEGIEVTNQKNVIFAETCEEYVDAICDLFSNKDKREKLGSNGRALIVEKYSYASIGQELAEKYSELKLS